ASNLKREGKELDKSMKLKKRSGALSDGNGAPPDGTGETPAKGRSILVRSGRCTSETRVSTGEPLVQTPARS
ncbi:hypothetical protein HAX54_041209, partial [Datura stramonium]|nr:hypothetical protein [Datura stramonium]